MSYTGHRLRVSAVIDNLVAFGPAIIRPNTNTPNHCVLATAVGVDVLRRFGLVASPLSVRVQVANAAWLAGVNARPPGDEPDWAAINAAGGWLIDTGAKDDPQTGTTDSTGWYGHLVVSLPIQGLLIDLNLGGMRRPIKHIHLPDAGAFKFTPPRTVFELSEGGQLAYEELPASDWWTTAGDWTKVSRRRDMVKALARAVRKGHL